MAPKQVVHVNFKVILYQEIGGTTLAIVRTKRTTKDITAN